MFFVMLHLSACLGLLMTPFFHIMVLLLWISEDEYFYLQCMAVLFYIGYFILSKIYQVLNDGVTICSDGDLGLRAGRHFRPL